jgi:hypothetical protein
MYSDPDAACRVSDAQEELEVARARGELSRLMRQNDTLEQELEEMDKKIGLLVQNRISVQDVIADRKKGRDLASYGSAGFGTFLQVSVPASHWLEDCANFTPTPEENDQYSANRS